MPEKTEADVFEKRETPKDGQDISREIAVDDDIVAVRVTISREFGETRYTIDQRIADIRLQQFVRGGWSNIIGCSLEGGIKLTRQGLKRLTTQFTGMLAPGTNRRVRVLLKAKEIATLDIDVDTLLKHTTIYTGEYGGDEDIPDSDRPPDWEGHNL